MSSIETEAFPYTVNHISRILNADVPKIVALCNTLDIKPRKDDRSGQLLLRAKDVELLRKALEADRQSESQHPPARVGSGMLPAKSAPATPPVSQRTGNLSRVDLSLIVDTMSNVKEGILKDLSQLLDDKLSGLDEVVVELIRSKSENDSLREELKRLEESREQLQSELGKFKPAAFGFYRKEG